MRTCLALLLAPGAALDPLARLQVVSLARPPESQLLSAKLSVDDVACWKWKEAAMGDGAGSSCNGVERALAQRLRADGGECVVLSTCARLDVYAYGCGDVADAAARRRRLASQFRRSRPFAPRYGDVDVRPHLAVATGAAAARHVFEVACFAGLRSGQGRARLAVLPRHRQAPGVALAGAALADARMEVAAAVSDGVVEPAVGKLAARRALGGAGIGGSSASATRRSRPSSRPSRRTRRAPRPGPRSGRSTSPRSRSAGAAPAPARLLDDRGGPSATASAAPKAILPTGGRWCTGRTAARLASLRALSRNPRRRRRGFGTRRRVGPVAAADHRMESGIHRRASTHQRRPTEVLLHGSDAAACDRLRALRKAAVVDGLDGAARPVAWKLLLGVGRCDAKRYGALVARAPAGPASPSRPTRGARSGPAARARRGGSRLLNASPRARGARGGPTRPARRRGGAARAPTARRRRRRRRARPAPRRRRAEPVVDRGRAPPALPSELEAFWCLEALVAAKAPTYFTPNLGGAAAGACLVDRCLAVVDPELYARLTPPPPLPRLGTRRRASSSGSSHGAALLGAESSPASRRGARPLEDLFAFPLLASLFACAPPLAEVVVLWDALLALGVHSGVLLCAALCVSLRDELLLDPDPLARLQPRNLPPLGGRRLVCKNRGPESGPDAMATPTWMTTVESAARTLKASLASYESTDVTSTITALKPHEMADPTAWLLPACRGHPMCCRALTTAGKQHGKPLRDMCAAELDAAIEHRRLGGHASCPADVDGLTAAEKIKVLAPIIQREVLKGDQFKQLHDQRLRYATQSVLPVLMDLSLEDLPSRDADEDHRGNLFCSELDFALLCGLAARVVERVVESALAVRALERCRAELVAAEKKLQPIQPLPFDNLLPGSEEDDGGAATAETKAAKRRRLHPLALALALRYSPPRAKGEISGHTFAKADFKNNLFRVSMIFSLKMLSQKQSARTAADASFAFRLVSRFLATTDIHFETVNEAYAVEFLGRPSRTPSDG
ncbi:hypothetical protein JL722_9931 [Aureococcus anophagefferens]|nr:hypothetical protein JL722_9931 [Aureococcus anophagefferens]